MKRLFGLFIGVIVAVGLSCCSETHEESACPSLERSLSEEGIINSENNKLKYCVIDSQFVDELSWAIADAQAGRISVRRATAEKVWLHRLLFKVFRCLLGSETIVRDRDLCSLNYFSKFADEIPDNNNSTK